MLRRPLPLLLACVALIAGGVATGCGSSSGSSGSGLTAMVPREALAYVEVTLRPSGGAREGALGAAGKLLATSDPAGRIRRLLQQGFAKADPPVNFSRDIEPWLGDRAAVWVGTPTGGAGAEPPVGAIVQTTDAKLAQRKLESLTTRSDGKPVKRSIDGHEYEVHPRDHTAVAFRDDEILVGTEATVKRMLTLPEDGSLAKVGAYGTATGRLDRDRLVTLYVDMNRVLDYSARLNPQAAGQLGALRGLIGRDGLKPAVGQLTANATRLAFDTLVSTRNGRPIPDRLGNLTASALFKRLPASSWAAFALPKVGRSLQQSIDRAAGGFGAAAIRQQLQSATGLDLQQDLSSWIGDVGMFARGTTIGTVDGGLVIEITNQARATTAFGKFVGIAQTHGLHPKPIRVDGAASAFAVAPPNAPKPVVLARSADRMVLAFGTPAAAEGLSPSRPLEQGPSYAKAAEALGAGFMPSTLFSLPAIVSLVDSAGKAGPGWQRARPYLEHLGVISTGAKRDGDTLRARVVLGLE